MPPTANEQAWASFCTVLSWAINLAQIVGGIIMIVTSVVFAVTTVGVSTPATIWGIVKGLGLIANGVMGIIADVEGGRAAQTVGGIGEATAGTGLMATGLKRFATGNFVVGGLCLIAGGTMFLFGANETIDGAFDYNILVDYMGIDEETYNILRQMADLFGTILAVTTSIVDAKKAKSVNVVYGVDENGNFYLYDGKSKYFEDIDGNKIILTRKNERRLLKNTKRFITPEGYFTYATHGSPFSIRVNDFWMDAEGFVDALKKSGLYKGQDLILISCETGMFSNGIAQDIAILLQAKVHAPPVPVYVNKHGQIFIMEKGIKKVFDNWRDLFRTFYPN